MAGGFRGPNGPAYAGIAGADLENAPQGPVPFTSPIGIPVTRVQLWSQGGNEPGSATGGVPGMPVQRVSGNPAVATTNVHGFRSGPYGGMQPGSEGPFTGGADGVAGIPQFGFPRPLQQGQESDIRAPGNAPVGYSNDKLTTTDRHGMMKTGYENSGRGSGQTDPPMDGPARPSLWLVQRSLNYQLGTDRTAATDDLSRDYTRNAEGMYIGEQGTGWAPVYGGVPGLYQEYGSYQGVSPASPPAGTNTSVGIHSPTGEGQPGDGPHDVWSGPPHGLHSPTLPTYVQTIGRYMAVPQQVRPRVDRPANSPIAGQSYSQTVLPQGQANATQQTFRMSGSPFNMRATTNGWRGRAAG